MIIHNPILTGSFTVNGTDVASITSSAASITAINSYTASQNILNGTYTLTSSFAAQTASFTAFTSSVNSFTSSLNSFSASILSYTASQNILNGTYATTGSNTFAGIQTVNSNLIVTGSITAQTLVVQTITSSVDFVTGSTRFGSLLDNTHVFTGSVSMTGSLALAGAATFSSSVNVGGTTITDGHLLNIVGSSATSNIGIVLNKTNSTAQIWGITNVGALTFYDYTAATERMRITSGGNVLIGTTTDSGYKLDVNGTVRFGSRVLAGNSIFIGEVQSSFTLLESTSGNGIWLRPAGGSDPTGLKIATTGAATFSSTISVGSRLALQPSYFGYSSSYKTLLIGGAGTDHTTNAVTLAFNVDITANPGGSFTGNGAEYIWRNVGSFKTPNAANTEYNTLFSWNSSGQLTFNQAATFSSTITAGSDILATNSSVFAGSNNTTRTYMNAGEVGATYGATTKWIINRDGYAGDGSPAFLMGSNSVMSGIGASAAGSSLFFTTNGSYGSGASYKRMTIDSSGNIGAPSGTNIYNASDIRLKQNVATITDGLNKIMGLNPVKFNWINNFVEDENDKDILGFVAQEVQNIIPEAVENFGGSSITVGETTVENPLRVNEKFIIPVLVKAIQELKAEFDAYKATHP